MHLAFLKIFLTLIKYIWYKQNDLFFNIIVQTRNVSSKYRLKTDLTHFAPENTIYS